MKYKNIYITLRQDLFDELEEKVIKNNKYYYTEDAKKIMMDKAVFLIDHIGFQKSLRKDDVGKYGYIRIPSKVLNIFMQKELKKYKKFLVSNNFIKTIPYSKVNSNSYGYKVVYRNLVKKNQKNYMVYEFLSITYEQFLSKNIEKVAGIYQKKKAADRNTRHLTKWINKENISIDWKAAFKFIDTNKLLTASQKEQYSYSVNRMRYYQWYYVRSTNDNRLHSNLTNFPSVLRGFSVT